MTQFKSIQINSNLAPFSLRNMSCCGNVDTRSKVSTTSWSLMPMPWLLERPSLYQCDSEGSADFKILDHLRLILTLYIYIYWTSLIFDLAYVLNVGAWQGAVERNVLVQICTGYSWEAGPTPATGQWWGGATCRRGGSGLKNHQQLTSSFWVRTEIASYTKRNHR